MAWQLMDRKDLTEHSGQPCISVSRLAFGYNRKLVRLLKVNSHTRVSVYADAEAFRLAFEFHEDPTRRESYQMTWRSRRGQGYAMHGASSGAHSIIQRLDWVRRVAELPDARLRRFIPQFDGTRWIIQLWPAFERTAPRDGDGIPGEATGIYRYVREETDEVVYVGRGVILQRLREPERRAWEFDRVEYSPIKDAEAQARWERHWIEAFRQAHGRLPRYNRL